MSVKQYDTTDDKGRPVKRWKVDFYVQGHRERKRDFKTKKEAKDYQTEFTRVYKKDHKMTLASLYEFYIKHSKARGKDATLRSKLSVIPKWILSRFGDDPMDEISTSDLTDWQNDLLESSLKASSCRLINSHMRSIFDFAVMFIELPKNPVPTLKVEGETDERLYITQEQLELLIAHEKKEIYKHIMIILFWTGIRKGELLALTFEDFDLEKRTLRINKSIDDASSDKTPHVPKTRNSVRTIEINDSVIKSVERLQEMMYDRDRPIFIDLANGVLYKHIRALGERCGISYLGVHTFRHSHATFLLSKRVDPLIVSRRLGHSNVSTTIDTYAHVVASMRDELHDVLNESAFDYELTKK